MISYFLNILNKKKNFPFYFITPTPYAIGTASEHILIAASKSKKEKKSLVILYTNLFAKKLKYFICNKALFNNLVFTNNSKKLII